MAPMDIESIKIINLAPGDTLLVTTGVKDELSPQQINNYLLDVKQRMSEFFPNNAVIVVTDEIELTIIKNIQFTGIERAN